MVGRETNYLRMMGKETKKQRDGERISLLERGKEKR
jgi:hypothetical protein